MGKTSKQNQKANSCSSSITSIEDKPIKKTKRTRKSVPRDSPQQRSSIFRGVTRHRWTGRYEAHLWDKNCWNESQNKKGRQVYLGAYDDEEAAAHAYDLAALKYWGQDTILNFPLTTYQKEVKEMEEQTKEEYIGSLRRKSSGFSRGVSKYRGVARHHHNGRWEARIGRVFGNKYLYLGTYATQEEAATAYDMAAIEYRGVNAVTNFDLSRYIKWLRPNQIDNTTNNLNIDINNTLTIDNHNNNFLPQDLNSNPLETDSCMPTLSHQDMGSSSSSFLHPHHHHHHHHHQSSSSYESPAPPPPARPPLAPRPTSGANSSTALGLLLQSSKFKEMLERTSTKDETPSTPQESSAPPRRSFPDDIQTYFDCQDMTINFADEHEGIFGDFASAMFPCELDT